MIPYTQVMNNQEQNYPFIPFSALMVTCAAGTRLFLALPYRDDSVRVMRTKLGSLMSIYYSLATAWPVSHCKPENDSGSGAQISHSAMFCQK